MAWIIMELCFYR